MFLRELRFAGYGIFNDATLDLRTDVDHPIVLITGNNGAGKTSILESLRLVLHGRRAFDSPVSEAEYLRIMEAKFSTSSTSSQASLTLDFDYVDIHKTRHVILTRGWTKHRNSLTESLDLKLDGQGVDNDEADDLLQTIVPPQIARYFFFDGERIKDLAEWDVEDESALFTAVADLLGLGVIEQLRADLTRLSNASGKGKLASEIIEANLATCEANLIEAKSVLKQARTESRKIKGAFERARAEVRRVGAMRHEEVVAIEYELAGLSAERRSLIEEAQRASGDILPLLCARTLRARFGAEIESRKDIEDRIIVTQFISKHSKEIADAMRQHSIKASATISAALAAVTQVARGTLTPVSDISLPNLSRNDSIWMQRVIEHELPEMATRNGRWVDRFKLIDSRIALLETKRRAVPVDDPASEAALSELERCHRALVEHESGLALKEIALSKAEALLDAANGASKEERPAAFSGGQTQDPRAIDRRCSRGIA